MPRARRSFEPVDLGHIFPHLAADEDVLWSERLAIEAERRALRDAIASAIAGATVAPPRRYQPPRTILRHPYLATYCTAAFLIIMLYLYRR